LSALSRFGLKSLAVPMRNLAQIRGQIRSYSIRFGLRRNCEDRPRCKLVGDRLEAPAWPTCVLQLFNSLIKCAREQVGQFQSGKVGKVGHMQSKRSGATVMYPE